MLNMQNVCLYLTLSFLQSLVGHMRIFDNKKGEKIMRIIYEYEPKGIWFRELWRKSDYSKDTLSAWLGRLMINDKIYKTGAAKGKTLFHISENAFRDIKNGKSILSSIPVDERSKRDKTSKIYSGKEDLRPNKIQFLILSRAAFENLRLKQTKRARAGNISIYRPDRMEWIDFAPDKLLPGVGILDLSKGRKFAYFPTNTVNFEHGELVGYLRIERYEAEKYIQELLSSKPPILKVIELSGHDEKRYIHTDSMLKEFFQKCVMILNSIGNYIGELYISNNLGIIKTGLNELSVELQLLTFEKWFKVLYGTSTRTYDKFDRMFKQKKCYKSSKENVSGNGWLDNRDLLKTYRSEILEYDLFDQYFKATNKKYNELLEKYSAFINFVDIMELIFPDKIKIMLSHYLNHV